MYVRVLFLCINIVVVKSIEDIRQVFTWSIIGKIVCKSTKLPSGATIGETMEKGLIFLFPFKTGYQLVLPLLLLHCINLKYLFIPEFNMLEPLTGVWTWEKFEEFEVTFERIKVMLYNLN
jgi:hypothetical protein